MESGGATEQRLMVLELTRGRDLLKHLKAYLDQQPGVDSCKPLASEILSILDTAICMAKLSDTEGGNRAYAGTDSSGSPRSENSDQEAFKDRERGEMSKKRKTLPKWTSQVPVGRGEGVEGTLDDGYSWRKYGQKDILGAKYPRAYYRCTHRNTRGCMAMKQVQRSDENPSVLDVTYRGTHTCHRRPQLVSPREQELKQNPFGPQGQDHLQQQQPDLLLSFQTGLRVKTEGLSACLDAASPSFSFPSTPVGCLIPENCFMGNFSPSFISPATSESNYLPVSPCPISSYGGGQQSDFTETVSAVTSATSSPMVGMDFMLDPVEFDPDFPFDASSFFS